MIAFKQRAELQDVGNALRMERRCLAAGRTLLIVASLGRYIFSHNLFKSKCAGPGNENKRYAVWPEGRRRLDVGVL